jgi:tetratricopeptide (TPR) repeat protein
MARPTIDNPMTGANISGKSEMTSTCNMEAMSFFARLFRIAPVAPAGPLQRGALALRAGNLDEAERCFNEALAAAGADRDRALAHNKRALVALARDDRPAAQAALDDALRTFAACVPAIVNAGNLLLEDGDIDGAIARFEAAIALDPDYPEAHHNLGVAYRRAGRRSDAVRELRRATGLERRRKNDRS